MTGRKEVNLEDEEDDFHREAELAYVMGLQAAKDALLKMKEQTAKQNDAPATKN